MKIKKKRLGLSFKIIGPILAIVLFLLFTMAITQLKVATIRTELDNIQNQAIVSVELVEELRYDVMRTVEVFMDISATHDKSELPKAETVKEEVHSLIAQVKEMDAESAGTWNKVLKDYDSFYKECLDMAEKFIKSGTAFGNNAKAVVDPLAEQLCATMDEYAKEIEENLEVDVKEIATAAVALSVLSSTCSVISLVIAGIITLILLKQVLQPVKKISAAIKKLSEHDLTVEEISVKQKDEIGDLIHAYNQLRGSLMDIMSNLHVSTGTLEQLSEHLNKKSDAIVENMDEITEAVGNVAQTATEQASDIENSIHEIEGLRAIVGQNEETSQHLSDASEQISTASRAGNKVVDDLYEVTKESKNAFELIFESINRIKNSTTKIGQSSEMIQSIASQTNLLSLNASIEAARAGEMGKGFAVVADEIRKLSEESAESANEITRMLQELQTNVEYANEQSDSVKKAVEKQVQGVTDTRSKYNDISESLEIIDKEIHSLGEVSRAMTSSCENVSAAMEHLAMAAETNAASSQETNASVEEVLAMIQEIAEGSGNIKIQSNELFGILQQYNLN